MTFPGPLGVASFCKRILVCALTFALANLTAQSVFAETGATNIVSGTTTQISGNYRVGTNGAYNALIVTNAGCFIVTGYSYIGSSAVSSNNNAWVTGPGSVWSNGSYLYVGNAGSFNSLTIANGGRVIDYLNGVIGNLASSSNNSVLVTGTGSVWSNSISSGAFTEVGGTGSFNRLTIANGGWVYDYGGSIGANALSSNNTVIVTDFGSVWTNSSGLYVGDEGSGNSLIITNGGVVSDNVGGLSVSASSSNNTAFVAGAGSVWSNSSIFFVGGGASGNSLTIANSGQVFNSVGYIG